MWRQPAVWLVRALARFAAGGAGAGMINLPGAIAGGVEICAASDHRCINTPDAGETPIKVVSYRDGEGEAVIMYRGNRYVAQANHVTVMFKGCNASLASFVQNKMCPGVRR